MKYNRTSISHKTIAYLLFACHLLTSCGFKEEVFDKKHEHMLQTATDNSFPAKEETIESTQSYGPYNLKSGYQVLFIKNDGVWIAQVTALLPPGFSSAPLRLPVVLQYGMDIQEVNSPQAYFDITLPNKRNKENGYVACARQAGLRGGMPPKGDPNSQCIYGIERYKLDKNGDLVCPSGNHTIKKTPPKKDNPPNQNTSSSSSQTYNPPRRDNPTSQSATTNRPINLHLPFGSNLPGPSRLEQVLTSDAVIQIMSGILDLGMNFVNHARNMDRIERFYQDKLERDLAAMNESFAQSTKRAEEWRKFYEAEAEAKATQEEEKKRKNFTERKKNSMKVGRSTCLNTDPTVMTSKMAIHFLSR
jgi:hypothetical protein